MIMTNRDAITAAALIAALSNKKIKAAVKRQEQSIANSSQLNWRGAWGEKSTYLPNDGVSHDGSSWVAERESTGSKPKEDSTDWGYLAKKGKDGGEGPQGQAGQAGKNGDAGPQGPAGSTGLTGPQGPAGAQGLEGQQGPAGSTGPQGPAGATGQTGPAGPAGATGLKGEKGDTGATGPQGQTGQAGPIGPEGIQGPTGPQGPRGMSGGMMPFYVPEDGDFEVTANSQGLAMLDIKLDGFIKTTGFIVEVSA